MKKRIQINHLGYMAGMPKNAVCRVTAGVFYLVEASSGISVYAGRLTCPFFDRESGDTVKLADFSDFNVCGSYFIRAGYRRSDVFEISPEPYKYVRQTALDAVFASRCGYDLSSEAKRCGGYAHKECHTEQTENHADTSGGWHTGAGYSKELKSVCLTIADMLYSLKLFGESFSEEEAALVTDECRWGLEWILKMQDKNGGVYEGVFISEEDNGEIPMPDEHTASYEIGKQTCSAALLFTAAAALGASFFSGRDSSFAKKLRRSAEKSWIAALQTKEYKRYCSRLGSTSENGDELDSIESEFMWAMCEMYAMTGEESFETMIREKYILSSFYGFGYSFCGGFAALSYLMNNRTKDRSAEAFIRKRLTDRADRMCIACKSSGYRTARSAGGGYSFGSNFAVLSDCMDFITAYLISGNIDYLEGAADQFGYIFGKNPMGTAYMTGCGEESVHQPYHMMSMALENEPPLSGMVVSGASVERTDQYSKWHIEKGTPPAKCYVDSEHSVSTNEASVHFSAPVIFISAFFDKVGRSALNA